MSLALLKSDDPVGNDIDMNGGDLTPGVSDLIEEYDGAKQRLESLLSLNTECSDEEISKADVDVATAFDALLAEELKSSQEVWKRTQFLLAEIRSNLDTGSLAERMAKTVEDDMLKMSKRS